MAEPALIFVLLALVTAGLLAFCPRCDRCRAAARAEALLENLLTEDERRQLRRRGYLEVSSPSRPGRTYRVPRRGGPVRVYEGGAPIMALCLEPVEPLPAGDVVLLHKLLIEGDEAEYLRIANHFEPAGIGVALRAYAGARAGPCNGGGATLRPEGGE